MKDLRKPAGKVAWGASISFVPWSQIAPLCAACADAEPGVHPKNRTSFAAAGTVTVAPALTCVVTLFSASSANPTRRHVAGVAPHEMAYVCRSISLMVGALQTDEGLALEYVAAEWTDQDCQRMQQENM